MTFMAASLFAMRVEEARAMWRDPSSAGCHRDGILGVPLEKQADTPSEYLDGPRSKGALAKPVKEAPMSQDDTTSAATCEGGS